MGSRKLGPKAQGSCMFPLNFQILADELVKACEIVDYKSPTAPFLSCWDQACLVFSSVGGQVLFRNSIVAPVLKEALAQTLAELPWFAGRLVQREDGRTYDVVCNNGGARLLVASTSATKDQLAAAMTPGPSMASNHDAFNVMAKYVLPRSADDIVKQQLPLATVLLVHLYGGGALLVPTAYHGLVDFEGLQTFVSHLSVAYNALLAKRSSSTSTGVGVGQVGGDSRDDGGFGSGYDKSGSSTNRNNGDNLSTSNNDKNRDGSSTSNNIRSTRNSSSIIRRGFFAPEAVERLCETNRLRPGSNPREAMAVLSKWSGPLALLRILYQLFVRGGGVEIRSYWIPPDRLADLKHAATQQLKKGMVGPASAPAVVAAATAAAAAVAGSESVPSAAAVPPPSSSEVEWVSTRDCLAARLMQVLHSIPLKRSQPSMFMLVIANLRPRVRPPLPDSQLGNHIWGARVDCVRPSEMELGEVAARVRLALTRDLPAQYCEIVRQMKMLTAVHAARQLITELIITRDPYKCLVAPEGPIMVNEWRVQYDLWQFGPEPPFAFNPVIPPGLSPNLVCSYPAAPHGGGSGSSGGTGGLFLMVSLHRAVWRQLDAVTGGDLVGAL